MIRVRVHRRPLKRLNEFGQWERAKQILETRELLAQCIPGHGIDVYFPVNDVRVFNKTNGIGRGLMRDWYIEPADHVALLTKEEKPSVVPPSSNG